MSRPDAIYYFQEMILRGNILAEVNDKDGLLGYVEHWRINFDQFGRIICKAPFWTMEENTTDGNIAYLANIWIKSEYRHTFVLKQMESAFFDANNSCEYYAGMAQRKRTGLVKCFKKSELKSSMFTGV